MNKDRGTAAAIAIGLSIAMGGFAVGTLIAKTTDIEATQPTPKPSSITGGISPENAIPFAESVRQANSQFVVDFIASGRDIQSLPRRVIEASSNPARTLDEATAKAQMIVRGSVTKTEFAPNPVGGTPLATVTVRINDLIKTPTAVSVDSSLQIRQLVGPVPGGEDGLLEYLDIDEPLFSGDEVVLLLTFRQDLQLFQNLTNTGIYYIRDGRVVPERSNPFGREVAGKTEAELISMLRR